MLVLEDNRKITVPLDWFPLLKEASKQQRENYRFIGKGIGLHFPEIDEDILVESLLK